MNDTLINFGSEIKVLSETADSWRVGGWAVVFGSKDISNMKDEFSDATDYDFENGELRSIYYNHGLDGTIKKTRIGRASLETKDAGVWYEGQISKRNDYLKRHAEKIMEGIKAGIFGTSTGAPAHLVDREEITGGHSVKMWPISEISITPTPAEPLTSCINLKALVELEAAAEMTGCVSLKSLMEPEADAAEDETKNEIITAPTSTPPDGMEFEAHSKSVLAAVGDIQERIEGLTELRCVKSERRWSEAKYAQLTQLADGLASSAEAIKVLAETHAPLSQEPSTETDTPDDLQALTLQTLWDYQVTCARLHGVAV